MSRSDTLISRRALLLLVLAGMTVGFTVESRASDNDDGGGGSGSSGGGGNSSGSGSDGSDNSGNDGNDDDGGDSDGGDSDDDKDDDRDDDDDDDDDSSSTSVRAAVKSGEARPLNEILAVVRKKYKGKVARIRLSKSGGRYIYSIRIVGPRNKLIDVRVNAKTRRIISAKGG